MNLDEFAAVLLDLDGTIYREDHVLPGAVELVRRLQDRGRKFACLSNSTFSPAHVNQRLRHMGIRIDPSQIYTAAAAAVDYVMERFGGKGSGFGVQGSGKSEHSVVGGGTSATSVEPQFNVGSSTLDVRRSNPKANVQLPTSNIELRTEALNPQEASKRRVPRLEPQLRTLTPSPPPRVFNLATEGVQEMLHERVHWVDSPDEPCDAVIVGTPTNVYATEDRQRTALMLLRTGATLIGTCADRVFPSPRGLEFGAGALSSMLAYAANVTPVFTGKPERVFFQTLCHRLEVDPAACLLIGDNLESDIAGAQAMGMKTILTLTGVARREDLPHIAAPCRPDRVIESLSELIGDP